jgi:DNA polymerase elongation subunit (family B)
MWDVMIHNYLYERHIVVPQKKESKKDEKYAGAYVADPVVGMHEWVVSFDLASLYPMLIQQYNISPETITDLKLDINIQDVIDGKQSFENENVAVAANGQTFRKDTRGFLPEMMENLYAERRNYKKQMIEAQKELEAIDTEIRRRGDEKSK